MGEAVISYLITTTVFPQPLKYKRNVLVPSREKKEEERNAVACFSGGSLSRSSLFIFEGKSFPKDSI